MSKKIRVGIIFGGRSGEHEVSIASALSVYNALDKSRYEVTLIGIDKEGRWLLPDPKPLLAHAENPMSVKLGKIQGSYGLVPYPTENQVVSLEAGGTKAPGFDVMMPIMHGTYGEDGTIQGMLELAQIPYVGAGVLGSALGMDKELSAKLFNAAGIATVPQLCVRKSEFKAQRTKVEERILKQFLSVDDGNYSSQHTQR